MRAAAFRRLAMPVVGEQPLQFFELPQLLEIRPAVAVSRDCALAVAEDSVPAPLQVQPTIIEAAPIQTRVPRNPIGRASSIPRSCPTAQPRRPSLLGARLRGP